MESSRGEGQVEVIAAIEHSVGLAAQLAARLGEAIEFWRTAKLNARPRVEEDEL